MTQNHDSKIRNQVTLLHKYEGILLFCLDEGSYLVYFFKKVKRRCCWHGLDCETLRQSNGAHGTRDEQQFHACLCLKTAHVPLKKTA